MDFLSNEVYAALEGAVSITWEGCHKIYICMDQESHDHLVSCDYEMTPVTDKVEAHNQLYEWFDASCSLRFIDAIECNSDGKKTYRDVIPQKSMQF